MASLNFGDKIIVASHNKGKIKEIKELLEPYGLKVGSAIDHDLEEPEETGETFTQNAILKAEAACRSTGHFALADDSGLEVEALDGMPGIYSARWAQKDDESPKRDFADAMKRIVAMLEEMGKETPKERRANFTCALALARPGKAPLVFEGKIFGSIVWPMRGDKGFGYDPFFMPDGQTQTFGEMEPAEKHAMSHRAEAFAKFKKTCLISS